MFVREERVLLGSMVTDGFVAELFLFYLNKVYMLHQWVGH